MARKWTRTEAFRFYNTEARNPYCSWSARSADGNTVAVSLWKHEFKGPIGRMIYDRPGTADWYDGAGKHHFFQDLAWAVANCDGIVRVVLVVRDPCEPGRALECYPHKNWLMRVTHLDPKAGAFRLEQAIPAEMAVRYPSSHAVALVA
jgi:hypothetical protein